MKIDESEIDDVAALSGSGAAYVYLLIEALRDAAIEDGMAPEKAAMLAPPDAHRRGGGAGGRGRPA